MYLTCSQLAADALRACRGWLKMASTLFDDTAASASLDHLEAQAASPHPRALPEHLGSSPWWPQELASGGPKVEDSPLSTTRCRGRCAQKPVTRAAYSLSNTLVVFPLVQSALHPV